MKEMQNIDDRKLWGHHQTDNVEHLVGGHSRLDMLFRKVRKYIKPGSKILEIGFGDGYLLRRLSLNYECFGADISVENVKQMREKVYNTVFDVIGVDGKLPYQDNSFDGFIASEVLEHMSSEELNVCITEMNRVLKIDGKAFITVPAEEDFKRNECFCPNCGLIFHKWGHKQIWNKDIISKNFQKLFIIEKISSYYNKFQGGTRFERFAGNIMWVIQTSLNFITDFPNKLFTNRSFVIILRKK